MVVVRRRKTGKKKQKAWYKRKYTPMELAQKAAQGVWYLKGLVNSERLSGINASSMGVGITGEIQHITNIAQGDTITGRTGNSVFVRSILGRQNFEKNSSATITHIRQVIFIDLQQVTDADPTPGMLLDSVSVLSPLSTQTQGRFKILSSRMFTLTEQNPTKDVYFYKNLRHHVRYNGTSAGDIQKGGIYVMTLSNEASNEPTCRYNWKVSYHDN